MWTTRISRWLAALTATLVCATSVQAQLFRPFDFPTIDSDFQLFAPSELEMFGGGPSFRTGWFASYDRSYINVSRPEIAGTDSAGSVAAPPLSIQKANRDGDFAWGHRYEVGFVDTNLQGWSFVGMHLNGPHVDDVVITERINRFNPMGSPQMPAANPRRDNNNRITGDRDYLVTNSINNATMTGIELNRSWAWKPLAGGGLLRPVAGFRYTKFKDFHIRQNYTRFDDAGLPIPPTAPGAVQATAQVERLTSVNSEYLNDLVGGQFGIAWNMTRGKWDFYGDVKAFGMQNFQNFNQSRFTEQTRYNAPLGMMVSTVTFERETDIFSGTEFVFGGEVRATAAYRVTRDMSVRVGFEFLEFGQGIGRGDNPNVASEEDATMFGVNVGVTVNR